MELAQLMLICWRSTASKKTTLFLTQERLNQFSEKLWKTEILGGREDGQETFYIL